MIRNIPDHFGLNCTINTTEDCNLRCKYCYETCKRPKSIDFDKCKKFIDLVLQEGNFCKIREDSSIKESVYRGRVFDFIGGDALIDPELLDKIMTYINTKWAMLEHKPPYGWRASLSSNGTLFYRKDVRDFCEKWKDNLHVGVSIDGCPEIHDMNRIYPDGSGSMKTILEWWPWFKKTFPTSALTTKATCAKSSIPYLYESLKWMHEELGLKYINQNFIMEDMHLEQSDINELDHQLSLCCDYVLDHCDDLYWAIFDRTNFSKNDPRLFVTQDTDFFNSGACGSGCMPALGIDGKIYPCFRWLPHTQNGNIGVMCVGDVDNGFITADNFRCVADGAIRANCTKEQKCRDCEFEHCCHYCIGGCYAEYGDFIRTTHICEVTKLTSKWTTIYWDRYEQKQHAHISEGEPFLYDDPVFGPHAGVIDYNVINHLASSCYNDFEASNESVTQMIVAGLDNNRAVLNPNLLDFNLFNSSEYRKIIYDAVDGLTKNAFLEWELLKNVKPY